MEEWIISSKGMLVMKTMTMMELLMKRIIVDLFQTKIKKMSTVTKIYKIQFFWIIFGTLQNKDSENRNQL